MKIIVGLGNPGKKYNNTRHNVGFLVLDKIAQNPILTSSGETLAFSNNSKFNADIATTESKGEKIILIKPQTFMNLSGQSVSKILQFYKTGVDDLIVVLDDVDIELGQIRIRPDGSSAGHNGLQNIIDELGTNQFTRVRVGISDESKNIQEIDKKDNQIETKDYVLSQFSDREQPVINKVIEFTAQQIVKLIDQKENIKAETLDIR